MPRLQTFVSNKFLEEINNIVEIKRQEGAENADANISSTASMLLELGLRVYKIQRERSEGGFSQMEFNKVMLEHTSKISGMCSEILRISSLSEAVKGQERFDFNSMSAAIRTYSDDIVGRFFPDASNDDDKS